MASQHLESIDTVSQFEARIESIPGFGDDTAFVLMLTFPISSKVTCSLLDCPKKVSDFSDNSYNKNVIFKLSGFFNIEYSVLPSEELLKH